VARRWYVVHTRAQAEGRALQHLGGQGFEAWLPEYLKRRRHARRTEQVRRPLFPRYLFVRLDLEAERWRSVLGTTGVDGLVGGDPPTPLADAIVDALRQRTDEEGLVAVSPALSLRSGDAVRIAEGPLADLEGVFLDVDDRDRVAILLHLMGRDIRVRVDARGIEKP
jgi:transcriptional antiterminator RfaH